MLSSDILLRHGSPAYQGFLSSMHLDSKRQAYQDASNNNHDHHHNHKKHLCVVVEDSCLRRKGESWNLKTATKTTNLYFYQIRLWSQRLI